MKFLAINDNTSVRKDEIIAVERNDSDLARVILENGSYDTNFPYETIMLLLEQPDIEEKVKESMTLKEAFHRPMQYFAH